MLAVLICIVLLFFTDRSIVSELRCMRVNISDFEVKKVIGRGHFGEVQVVREKQTGDVYAMKTLRKSDTLNHQAVSIIQYNLV
jgi:citron Rho-interacting kinase